MTAALDLVGAAFVLVGAFVCFAVAVVLYRFPDVLARIHAATKPTDPWPAQCHGQPGAVTVDLGGAQHGDLDRRAAAGDLTHLRAPGRPRRLRSDQLRRDLLTRDDLAENLTAAGFTATDWPVPDDDPTGRDTDVG